jgi:hypothetical protein
MRILITGGPVHAYLDAVKIITNKFKGGLMAELADKFKLQPDGHKVEITYLTAKGMKVPSTNNPTILYHDGFEDYRYKVKYLAPDFHAIVLGAAVANLIPLNPLKGKFPSHNYKVGDRIPIDFTIAPRIIDEVKFVAPKTHLFGFKLLSGVPHEELISAAYGVLLESKATAVFANDAKDLMHKYAVTKERGVHPMNLDDMAKFIRQCVDDAYYHTRFINAPSTGFAQAEQTFGDLAKRFADKFTPVPEGYVFGTIAIKMPDGSFLTTGRGKNELDDLAHVHSVDHDTHTVFTTGIRKATLNAPLLDWIFRHNGRVSAIVHFHWCDPAVKHTLEYAIPGTVRDSKRLKSNLTESFYIKGHGSFLLLDKNLQPL